MSIHGVQKFLPYTLDKNGNMYDLPVDYVLGFKQCLNLRKEGEKLVNFSRLAFPLILIQGVPSLHIVLDDVGINDLELSINNPPRQGTIGHVLRNIDNRSYVEMLDLIQDIILYTEAGKNFQSSDSKDEEIEEFKKIEVKGMIGPEILDGLKKIIPNMREEDISEYALLESKYSVEIGLNLGQQYKSFIDFSKGNKIRWNSIKNLIETPFNQWLNELRAQIKDTELRYKSTISKEEQSISAKDVQSLLKSSRDLLDQENMQDKKNILEKIGGLFSPIDQILEDISEKNKPFVHSHTFKTLNIDRAIQMSKDQIEFIEESVENIKQKIEALQNNFDNYLEQINKIDEITEEKYRKKELELKTQLVQRNTRIQSVSEASESFIDQLKGAEEILYAKLEEINNIIDEKKTECDKDVEELLKWGISDADSNVTLPVLRLFIPVYAALYEDEEEEERLVFTLPCIFDKDLQTTEISDGFQILQKKMMDFVEKDMKIRSNFEFTMDRLNLLKSENFEKVLISGFRILKKNQLATPEMEKFYLDKLANIKSNL